MSKWSLRVISLVAYGIFGIGILCNMIFYSGFGNGFSTVVYAFIGVLFDLAKVISIVAFVYLVRDERKPYHRDNHLCHDVVGIITAVAGGGVWFLLPS
jgi:hypothetical protein